MSESTTAVRPTKKQRELLDFIDAFITQHGYSPSYREIMNGCGYSSIATVAVHINNLITRGHLRKRSNSARSLELTQAAVPASAVATVVSPAAHVSGADWLAGQVESLLDRAEAAAGVSAQAYGDLLALLASLRVLGLNEAAAAFQPRMEALTVRINSHDSENIV